MHSVRATSSSTSHYPTDTCEPPTNTGKQPEIEKIIDLLVAAALPGIDVQLMPLNGVWDALLELDTTTHGMTHEQKRDIQSTLSEQLTAAAQAATAASKAAQTAADPSAVADGVADISLLQEVIKGVLGSTHVSPAQYLADKAWKGLRLPNLTLREDGETEPNARTFYSVLPSVAASTYDYQALGRTLLWKGVCQLFAGPSEAERGVKLQRAIFSFPNPPEHGEEKLEDMFEFVMAVDGLGLDQPVDTAADQQQTNRSTDLELVQDI